MEVLEFVNGAGILQLHASIYGQDGLEGIASFWERASECETLREICMHACGGSTALIVHVDGVGTFRNSESDVWSFSSIHAASSHGSPFDVKFPLCILEHHTVEQLNASAQKTLHTRIAECISWQQKALISCVHPRTGFYDEPLDRKWTGKVMTVPALIFGWQGDLKARKEAHCSDRYYRTKFMCDTCDAQLTTSRADPQMSYKHFADDAAWEKTIIPLRNRVISPWQQVSGICAVQVFRDEMHMMAMGSSRWIASSTIRSWDCNGHLRSWATANGSNQDDVLDALWDAFRAWCNKYDIKCISKCFFQGITLVTSRTMMNLKWRVGFPR